jgi:hypothetical protein
MGPTSMYKRKSCAEWRLNAMPTALESMLSEFREEVPVTRRVLERVPAVFHPSPKPLKIPANSVECSTRIGRFFRGFSPYWGPFGDPLFMPSQLTVWRFTSLLNGINHPHPIWRRLRGYWQREHHASPRRFGQISSGDVFRCLVGDRLKDLLPSLADRPSVFRRLMPVSFHTSSIVGE